MSKLSDSLKALINTPASRPGTTPAPHGIRSLYERIGNEALSHRVSRPSWITLSVCSTFGHWRNLDANWVRQTAATMTMNSPDSMSILYQVATDSQGAEEQLRTAELMREVGLKCIGFNGVSSPQFL
jgi:hypothetical protein